MATLSIAISSTLNVYQKCLWITLRRLIVYTYCIGEYVLIGLIFITKELETSLLYLSKCKELRILFFACTQIMRLMQAVLRHYNMAGSIQSA